MSWWEFRVFWGDFAKVSNGVFPCAVSACRQTAAFPVACSKLRPNSLCFDAEVLSFAAVLSGSPAWSGIFRSASVCRCSRRRFQTAVSVCLVGRKAFISLSFFYGASRLGAAITATICAVSCYNPPALPIRPSEAHFQTASTKEKTNHEPIPLARYRQPAARPAPAG